jgi:hypothetical protein
MRDSCIFYRSFYESINELPDINKLEIYNAIFSYSLNFIELELTGLSKSIFTLIKPQLDANIKRFNNGNIPKDKQTKSKTEAKQKQKESKREANNNVNNNNNVNDNKNKEEKINFDIFYNLYDKKVDGKDAKLKWDRLDLQTQQLILSVVPKYIKSTPDKQFRKSPLVYLNKKAWEDEIIIEKEFNKPVQTYKEPISKLL